MSFTNTSPLVVPTRGKQVRLNVLQRSPASGLICRALNTANVLFSVHFGHQPHQRGGSRHRRRQLRPGHGHVGGRPRKGEFSIFRLFSNAFLRTYLAPNLGRVHLTSDCCYRFIYLCVVDVIKPERSLTLWAPAHTDRLKYIIINSCWLTCITAGLTQKPLTFARG